MTEHEKTIESLLHEERVFNPPKELSEKAYVKSLEEYRKSTDAPSKIPKVSGLKRPKNSSPGSRSGTKCSNTASPTKYSSSGSSTES